MPGVVLPASVVIPAGTLSQKFCYSLDSSYDWRNVLDVRAQLGSDLALAYASRAYTFGFSETLSPADQQAFYPGQSSAPITVTLASSQGYSSTVHLSCESIPPGSSCQFGSTTLLLPVSGSISTTLVINAAPDALFGGTVQVVTDDGSFLKKQPLTFHVQRLVLYASGNFRGTPGSTIQANVLVNGIPPYSPSCSGLPAGLTCTFSGEALAWPSISTYTIFIPVPISMAAASYPFTVTVNSGPLTTNLGATLDVIDFAFQGVPSVTWMPPGGSVITLVDLQPIDQFNLSVDVSCSLSIGGSCAGSTAIPGISPARLNISVPQGTPLGNYTLTVTAIAGTLTHMATFPFSLADYSGSLSGNSLSLTRGASGSPSATVNATDGFAAKVSFSLQRQRSDYMQLLTVDRTAHWIFSIHDDRDFTAGPGAAATSRIPQPLSVSFCLRSPWYLSPERADESRAWHWAF